MTSIIDPAVRSTWQVPEFSIQHWHGKQRQNCIVIPVINEGNRIINLLKRMQSLDIAALADIIIVDGGSTDGSLDAEQLNALDVRALLTKTGRGKLSAQLRCAYAFALDAGYLGIITIDGNDKDDPAAIPSFLAALEQGIDFVQASRFVKNGVAVNTPAARDFAIRFIHAPALSFASGFPWTDTTQGFRAYSRRILLDERVAPFRNIFISYELLAYLSYRIPKLGYACCELPTTRQYPVGDVPTKIGGLKGNLAILKILFKACRGHYNPGMDGTSS